MCVPFCIPLVLGGFAEGAGLAAAATLATPGFAQTVTAVGDQLLKNVKTVAVVGALLVNNAVRDILPNTVNKSVNQINQEIKRGQAPRGIVRADKGLVKGEQDNIHVDGGPNFSLNRDGTWKHGGRPLTNKEQEWLTSHGWKLPN